MDRDPNQTQAGTILGTPAYMSPEQARGEVVTLGPPTDIYGLGAILYCLLTGQPPVKQPTSNAVLEHVRAGRITPPAERNPRVPRPLDAVCRKALSQQPLDRYRTALDLAADITRWLNDEPVSACREPLPVRARRWMRQHPALVGSTAAAVLVAVTGLSLLSIVVTGKNEQLADGNRSLDNANRQLSDTNRELEAANERETGARELAEANELLAETNAESARQQSQLALSTLNAVIFDVQSNLQNLSGGGPVRQALLNSVLERLDQVSTRYVAQSAVDRNTMVAMSELADVILRLGKSSLRAPRDGPNAEPAFEHTTALATAAALYHRAHDIAQELTAADPTDAQAQRDLSLSYNKLGVVRLQSGRVTEAFGFYRQMNEILTKLAAADPADAQAQRDLSASYDKLGNVTRQVGQVTQALGFYRQSLEILTKLAAADPTDALAQRDLSVSYEKLGDVSRQVGQMTEAVGFYRTSLETREKLAAANPTDAQAQRDLMFSHYSLGGAQRELLDYVAAAAEYQAGIVVLDRMIENGQNVAASRGERGLLVGQVAEVEQARVATGDWESVLEQPVEMLPGLLTVRCAELAKRQRLPDVAQAAAKLGELAAAATDGQARMKVLYSAVCGYGLCAKLASGWDGRGAFPLEEAQELTDDQRAVQRVHIDAALTALKAAIAAGWKDFEHLQQDPDLSALHPLPEFKALLPAKP